MDHGETLRSIVGCVLGAANRPALGIRSDITNGSWSSTQQKQQQPKDLIHPFSSRCFTLRANT